MSSSRNPNQRSSQNNIVNRMESPNFYQSTTVPVNIHGGTFHGGTFNFGSSSGINSRSQSPHVSDAPLHNPNE